MISNDRLAALDGLRGWASLSVVIFHYCWETFGTLYPRFHSFIPSLLGNGDVAVAIFFTLSGYVLTLRRWGRSDNGILPLILVRRYLRLAIPVMAAVLIAWAIMSLGLPQNQQAGDIVQRPDWLGAFARFPPDIWGAIWFGAVRVYWFAPTEVYGPFLWTMIVELFGSVIVLTLSHWPSVRLPSYLILIALARLTGEYFPLASCIFIGALIALMQSDGLILRKGPDKARSFIWTGVLVCTLVAAALLQDGVRMWMSEAIFGVLVFLSLLNSQWVGGLLVTPLSRWLGHISFPLYLMQYPILIVPSSWLIVAVNNAGLLSPWTAAGISVLGVAMTILAGWAFFPIEQATLKVVRAIGAWPRRERAA